MKKNLLILMVLMLLMLGAFPVAAQQTTGATPSPDPAAAAQAPVTQAPVTQVPETQVPEQQVALDAKATLGYWNMTRGGNNAHGGAFEYTKSSVAGGLDLEWDQLPHRFLLESYALNPKDYFGALDYAYRDVVVFNFYARGLYHNLNHLTFGQDDPLTASPSFVDRNPGDEYATDNKLRRAFIRLKMPDFPFHFYVDAQTVERKGTIQERFMLDPGSVNKISQSREIDWKTQEAKVGMNSHLGPIEADLSHTEKTFESHLDQTLFDTIPASTVSFPHNSTPDLKGSTDTIKVHTTYSGRVVASGTYSSGDRKNEDSGAKADFKNMAGDVTYMPIHYLTFMLKYRHYDLTTDNPATSTAPSIMGTTVYNVRDSLSAKRDLFSGMVKYRLTPSLTVKAEYSIDTTKRDEYFGNTISPLQIAPVLGGSEQNYWDVAHSTTKTTSKAGLTYRMTNKLYLRTDYSAVRVDNPAYASDPDSIDTLKASVTWAPFKWVSALVSYGGIREQRDNLSAPLAGGGYRKTSRDQGLGSLTFLVGKRSSVTATYAQYQNRNRETLSYRMPDNSLMTEDGVLMATKSTVISLGATHALSERLHLSAEASRCKSNDKFRNAASGSSTQTANDVLKDADIVEDVLATGINMQLTKNLGSELRYQYRNYDDKVDNTQDGRVKTVLATLSLKW